MTNQKFYLKACLGTSRHEGRDYFPAFLSRVSDCTEERETWDSVSTLDIFLIPVTWSLDDYYL